MRLRFLDLTPSGPPVASIVPVPHDATTSWRPGARSGPLALLRASHQVECWDPELEADLADWPVETQEPVAVELTDLEAPIEATRERVAQVLAAGRFPFVIGGEHSVTTGAVAACGERHGPLALVQVDAHLDLRDRWQDSPWSHACAMRRCHQDLGAALLPLGIRSGSREDWRYAREQGIRVWTARAMADGPRARWLDEVAERLAALDRPVYLTVDLDGLDPALVPGTGTPEPGGLGWWDLLALVDRLADTGRVVGADLVELMDEDRSAFLAARLLAYMLPRFCARGSNKGRTAPSR